MLKTSKKVISLILVVFMLFTAFPLQGFAGEVEFDTLVQTQKQFNSNARVAGKNYCATVAAQWAIDHWNDYNSVLYNKGYWDDGGDCANFVSQCLYMGGMDMDDYWNISGYLAHWGTYYGSDYAGSYIRCQQLYNYLVKIGAQVIQNPSPSQVSVGDVILYRRQGASRMTHTAIVIDIKNGQPVVAAHSTGTDRYRSDWAGYDWHLNFSGNNTYLMKLNGTTCVNYNPRNFDVYVAAGGDTRLYVSASTSNGYYNTFLTGAYPDYAHVYKKSADGQWGYTFRYGKWGWIRLKNFTYLSHQESAPVSHDFGEWFVVQVADCKNNGIDKHVCKRCGYEETKTTKGGHIIDPKATCLSAGFCKICGEQCEKPLGHDWDNGTVTTKPTCTEEGVKTFVCKRDSSHTKTASVPALGHDHQPGATSPTCTSHGENVYTCSRCPDSYIVANPNGGWSEWMERDTAIESQLTADKIQTKTQYRYRDKKYDSSDKSTMSGWTHYDTKRTSWGVTQGPVYSDPSNGSRNVWSEQYISGYNKKTVYVYYKYGASELDYSYTYQTSSKPNYYEVELDYSPSSTSQRPVAKSGNQYQWYYGGGTSWAAVYFKETRTKDNLNSPIYSTRWYYQEPVYTYYFWQWGSWSSWSDTKATGTSDREVQTRTRYKYDLTALGHNWKDDAEVQVCKCGTNESSEYCYAEGQICTRCGVANPDAVKYYEHNYGPKYEISNVNGVITYREDCQNSNCDCYRLTTDKSCSFVVTETVKATCTTDGYEISTCTYHGETNKVITEPALGHDVPTDDAKGVVIKAATCTEDGIFRKYCERYDDGKTCGHYVDTPIPAFGHTMTKQDAISATCTTDGQTEYYQCELCHKFYADEKGDKEIEQDSWVVPAYDHVPTATVDWIVVKENGCGKTGWKHKLCNREVDGVVCNHVIDIEAIPEIPADYYVFDAENAELIDGEWYPTRCDADAILYITCRNCEGTDHAHGSKAGTATYDEDNLGRLPHLPGDKIVTEDPYCIYPGAYEVICERCYTILEEGIVPAPCAEHNLIEIKADGGCVYKKCINAPCDYIEGGDHNFQRDTSRDVLPTCTENGLEANTCTKCGEFNDTVIDYLGHDYAEDSKVDPTCTEDGYTLYKCQRVINTVPCNSTYKTDLISPLGHDLKKTDAVAPLCEKDGNIEYYTCQRDYCQKIFDNEAAITEITIQDTVAPQLGHEPDNNWVVTKEPTCAEKGEEQCKCVRHDDGVTCDKIYTREIEINPDAHNWDDGVIDPSSTCNTHGTKTYTCKNDSCHQYTEEVPIDPDNHVGNTYIKDVKKETCTEDGYTGDTYCSDCNVLLVKGEVVPACGHDWGEWTTVTPATCEEDGLEHRICKNDASHIEENVLKAIGHDWDDGVVETPATCSEYGSMIFTCKNDSSHKNVKMIVPLDPDNHVGKTYIKDAKEPTCTVDGYTGDTYCSDCNAMLEEGEVIPAHGHDWDEWTTVTAPTCEEDGLERRICKIDSTHVEENVLKAIGHDWDDGVIDPSSTCNTHGTKTYTCQNDNSHKKTEEVALDATNHVGETYTKDAKEATCTEDGYTGDTYCADCNEKLTDGEVIPAYGHDWDEWTVETEPTCEGKGLEKRVCKNDANHIEENELEPIGHKWDDGVIDPSSSCKENGTKTYTCQNDNSHTYTEKVELNPDGHYGETYIKDAKEPTCTEEGYTGDTYCSDCNEKLKDGEVIPAHGHDWDEWETTKKPTCDVDGEKERVCKYDDSHTEKGDVPATGHTPVNNPSVEPTCTEDGYTGDTVCSVCDKLIEEGSVVPETGHAYGEWETVIAATCENEGLEKRICANDASHVETRKTEVLGHDMGEWHVHVVPTIDSKGVERRDCQRDGCEYYEERELGVLPSYTITFIVPDTDGSYVHNGENYRVVEVKRYPSDVTKVTTPAVPELNGYIGYWEEFEPDGTDLVVKAKYELKTSDNESELKSDKDVVYKDGIATITLSAYADTLNAKVPMGATPCDVILILDQSNSMISNKIGTKTRLQVLQDVATSFIGKVYESAIDNNVDHRIAIAGFSAAASHSYNGTGLITPTGTLVKYNEHPDYANAFVDVRDNISLLENAISKMSTGNGTSAELGMDMAQQIIANNNDGRKKIVIFITDGEPTRLSVSYGFSEAVANEAIQKANVIKNVYGADIYSIGVASGADPADETKNFNKFLHYVSSNYPDALELTNSGQASLYKNYFITAEDAKELEKIFDNIVAQQISNTITFNKVSFYDTVSEYFTLTIENENALRESVKAEYGITDEDITITRNADGTTTIKIDNLNPKPVYNESNIQTGYGVTVSFDVTANEKTLDGGTFVTNTKDAGVQSGGVTVIDFKVPEGKEISSGRAIVEFRIGDEVYAIQEVEIGDKIVPPETNMAEWIVTDDTTVTKDYTVISTEYSSETRTITWYIDGEKFVDTYHIGEMVAVPEVTAVNDKVFVGWDTVVPYRMPDSNLVITAQYEKHTHDYEQTGYDGDCLTGITTTYKCECGDSYAETIKHEEHTYTAHVQKDENKSVATMVCVVCGETVSKTINYKAVYSKETSYGYWPNNYSKTQILDLSLYNSEDVSIQPDGYIYVKFPPENADLFEDAKDGTMIIRRVNEDGTIDEIRKLSKPDENKVGYYIDGTYIVLKLDHFSYYVLTAEDEISTIPTYGQIECAFEGHDYKTESVDSSCVDGGYVKYECSLCGDAYTEGETDANGHAYESVVTAPTCTTDGYTTYICTVCNFSYVADEVKSNGHNYNETVVAPTCTTAGYTTFVCVVCDDSYVGNNVAATGHNIVDRVVESDCTNGGYTVHECTECDYSYVDSTTSESGHNYVQTVVPATCTATGYTNNVCSDCGHSYVSDETTLAAHTPSDWTLSAEGKYVKICTVCNAVVETRVSDIAINGTVNGSSSMTVYYKMSKPLDVTASAGKIIYTSADPSIATVDEDGRVTGVKKGTTTITATIEGTNDSVTCEVTVKYTWWQQIIRIALLGFLWY